MCRSIYNRKGLLSKEKTKMKKFVIYEFRLWHGRVPKSCQTAHPGGEEWRCYFGYRLYPTLKSKAETPSSILPESPCFILY